MPITAEPGALSPRLSSVATGAQPDLPFHVLLSINKSAARAMKSAVAITDLNAFITRLGFHTDHKNVLHVGDVDPRFDMYGTSAAYDTLKGMGAQRFAAVDLGPNVTVTALVAERWQGYLLLHVTDCFLRNDPANPQHYIHLFKVMP